MISVEDEGARGPVVVDKEPEGLHEIVEQSRILEASHVREVGVRWQEKEQRKFVKKRHLFEKTGKTNLQLKLAAMIYAWLFNL